MRALAISALLALVSSAASAHAQDASPGSNEPEVIDESAAPQSVAPQSAAPQSAAPQSAAPQSAAPQSAAPQSPESPDAPTEDVARVASDPRVLVEVLSQALDAVRWRKRGVSLAVEVGGSFLGPLVDFSARSMTVNYGVRVGYHFDDWAFVLGVEHAMWRAPDLGSRPRQHALNLGFGLVRYHRSGLLRTMILAGPSILIRDNDLDDAGDVGIFVDLRPLGFTWRFGEHGALVADLIHMTLVAPVLTGVPLADFQFRSSLGLETIF